MLVRFLVHMHAQEFVGYQVNTVFQHFCIVDRGGRTFEIIPVLVFLFFFLSKNTLFGIHY